MKGIVFTTFIEMVERKYSLETADRIITESGLASGGSYTSVGTYDHGEIISLVSSLSKRTGVASAELVQSFGEYLFAQLAESYPQFVSQSGSLFDFLCNVDNYIHVEVRKLYPDAELPAFQYDTSEEDKLIMVYRSSRPFADLAEGLIRGSIAHFGEHVELIREDLAEGKGTAARFVLARQSVEP